MNKVFQGFMRLRTLNKAPKRTFLSQAYHCKEVWDGRLASPILQKVNLDILYHELEQNFQKTRRISPVDVDIFANAVKSELFIDEMLDLVHKLRLSSDTGKMLESTGHAVIRNLLQSNKIRELLLLLDDRLNYGVFIDDYTANLLMDHFWKSQNYAAGSIIAAQLMLQEDIKHPINMHLGLLHCYNYLVKGGDWPTVPPAEEPEEEVKVRVQFLRNPYNDQHFDLKEPREIVGKTLAMTARKLDSLQVSLRILGFCLYGKEDRARQLLTPDIQLVKEIIELVPEGCNLKAELLGTQLISANVEEALTDLVKESVAVASEKDIAVQCEAFTRWETTRAQELEKYRDAVLKTKRLAEIEKIQKSLKEKEEKLWFFENEENIELEIQEKEQNKVEQTVEKKTKKVSKEDEEYIPPEVRKIAS